MWGWHWESNPDVVILNSGGAHAIPLNHKAGSTKRKDQKPAGGSLHGLAGHPDKNTVRPGRSRTSHDEDAIPLGTEAP